MSYDYDYDYGPSGIELQIERSQSRGVSSLQLMTFS